MLKIVASNQFKIESNQLELFLFRTGSHFDLYK